MHLVIAQLPNVFRRIVPELEALELPDETRANCASCHMVPSAGECTTSKFRFSEATRCCTFHPTLPNYLVGRALRRDNEGARLLRARIAQRQAVVPLGVAATQERHRRQRELEYHQFGNVRELRCPYYVEGTYTCGIWQDRNAVCRTWYCRHVDGPRGRNLWGALQHLLEILETDVAKWCFDHGTPPTYDHPTEDWLAWYETCADLVETIPDSDLTALRTDEIDKAVKDVLEAATARKRPLPDVVVPRVAEFEDEGPAHVRMGAYWPYDSRLLPRTIFLLFAALDGERGWREAIAQVEAECGLKFTPDDVLDLYSAGLIDADGQAVEAGHWRLSLQVNGHAYLVVGETSPHEPLLTIQHEPVAPAEGEETG